MRVSDEDINKLKDKHFWWSRGDVKINELIWADIDALITNAMREAVESRIDTQPITSRFERLMDQVNNLNLNSASITSSPAYEQAKNVLQGLMKGLGK